MKNRRFLSKCVDASLLLVSQEQLKRFVAAATRAQGKGYTLGDMRREVANTLHLYRTHGTNPKIIFDIGGNVGRWSAEFLRQCPTASQVHIFEPTLSASDSLRARFGATSNVLLHRVAIGLESGRGIIHSSRACDSQASMIQESSSESLPKPVTQEWIEVEPLDAICMKLAAVPEILKIDVEGMEWDVLLGGQSTIRAASVVQIEVSSKHIQRRIFFKDFYEHFTYLGFDVYRDTNRGLKRITEYDHTYETFATTNYWASRSKVNLIGAPR